MRDLGINFQQAFKNVTKMRRFTHGSANGDARYKGICEGFEWVN